MLYEVITQVYELQVLLPNLPSDLVPFGKGADDNEVVKSGGEMPEMMDAALPHWELAAKYNLIDFELGVKLTGAGFPVYRGKGAQLRNNFV